MITVFTSSFNYSKHLRQAIESVLGQTYRDFEYHLIDYGSTDDTWKIMCEYTKDSRVKAIQIGPQPNKVISMNHSISIARGDFWVWCPADDYFHKTLLEKSRAYSKQYPRSVLYSDNHTIDDIGKIYTDHVREEFTDEQLKKEIWKRSVIGFTGIFIPMYVFREMKLLFPEDENYSEDYYWMIQAVMRGVKFRHIPEKLHYKREHKGSATNRDYKDIIANIKVIHEKLKGERDAGR
jgi:glycosyltransferase involved in cell wall biosynthesis